MTTRWQDIYNNLKQSGFKVYSPGQHKGECTENYIVVKQDGEISTLNFSSSVVHYKLLCYFPQNSYSSSEIFIRSVKETMKSLYPMITYTNQQDPPFYDDAVKGWMISLRYQNHVKN